MRVKICHPYNIYIYYIIHIAPILYITQAVMNALSNTDALFRASNTGDLDSLQALLIAGADVHARGYRGQTALHACVNHGHARCAQALLEAGADVGLRDSGGTTVLITAAQSGRIDCMQTVLAAGANVDERDSAGRTALHATCTLYPECMRLLLDAGADLEVRDNYGLTPLLHSLRWRSHEINPRRLPGAVMLAAYGADLTIDPENAVVVPTFVAAAARERLRALQPVAVAAARDRLRAAPDGEAAAADSDGIPKEVVALLLAEARLTRVKRAHLHFREELVGKLTASKAEGGLDSIEYNTISRAGREIAFRTAVAAIEGGLLAAAEAVEAARLRQEEMVGRCLGPAETIANTRA